MASANATFQRKSHDAQRDPGHLRAVEGDGEEQRRIDRRAEHRGDQRRLPPGPAPHPVEDGDVQKLGHQERQPRGHGDARRCKQYGQDDGGGEADINHPPRRRGAEHAVGEVRDQEADGVGEGAPGQPVVDRILDQHIRQRDQSGHGGQRQKGEAHGGDPGSERGRNLAAPVPSSNRFVGPAGPLRRQCTSSGPSMARFSFSKVKPAPRQTSSTIFSFAATSAAAFGTSRAWSSGITAAPCRSA